MTPGDLIPIALPDGRFGGAQILEATPHAVALRVFGVLFECAPAGALDFEDAPILLDHIAVTPEHIGVAVGHAPLPADALVGGYALWVAAGRRPVIDAPLAVLVGALLGD